MGTPRVVCLMVWDYHLGVTERACSETYGVGGFSGHAPKKPQGIPISMLDPATGKISEMSGPRYVDKWGVKSNRRMDWRKTAAAGFNPAAKAFWQPVMKGIMEILGKRGLRDAAMLGMLGDHRPQPEIVALWRELLPGVPWVAQGHHWAFEYMGSPVGYTTGVYSPKWALDPASRRTRGWDREGAIAAYFPRLWDYPGLTFNRLLPEWNIAGTQRGVGRLAADFFPVGDGRKKYRLSRRYPETSWANVSLRQGWLAAGPEGTVWTVRFEMLREGVQECEARIALEQALSDGTVREKLGEEKAARYRAILDERTRYQIWTGFTRWGLMPSAMNDGPYALGLHWYAGSGWQDRSEKLFTAAAGIPGTELSN
jgi:hypothetical protein